MRIVYLTTEAVPFAKTGGLADVCGALPTRVESLGHDAVVIMPAFRSIRLSGMLIEPTDISFAVNMKPGQRIGCRLLRSKLPDSDVSVWFVDQPQYFDRPALYGSPEGDYPDNAERFAFFCRAALQAMQRIGGTFDVVHCNDWQTGLIPAFLRTSPLPDAPSTILTIHNLAYQGSFPKAAFELTGLDWSHFNPAEFEYYDHLNFLKTGIVTADAVSTVSPRYAQEIRTPEHGCGLNQVLDGVSNRLFGIINGIDQRIWNPATDTKLHANYSIDTWQTGKRTNKAAIQREFDLNPDTEFPLIGLVGRLARQKGWDMILPSIRTHLEQQRPVQWIVLGSGDASIERDLRELARMHTDRFALHIGFSDALAHQIEAASDVFLMPSHYEPCGLNQLYSLRYGTVPIVTPTGGLADTVVDCNDDTLADGTATGFHIHRWDAEGLNDAIGRALYLRYHEREKWAQLVEKGMSEDWSWKKSAEQYVDLYAHSRAIKASSGR